MKKTTLILIIFLIIILTYFVILRPNFTGNLIEGTPYGYTKSICNQTHCKDYFIQCNGKELIEFSFTGDLIENKNKPIEVINKNNLCD